MREETKCKTFFSVQQKKHNKIQINGTGFHLLKMIMRTKNVYFNNKPKPAGFTEIVTI